MRSVRLSSTSLWPGASAYLRPRYEGSNPRRTLSSCTVQRRTVLVSVQTRLVPYARPARRTAALLCSSAKPGNCARFNGYRRPPAEYLVTRLEKGPPRPSLPMKIAASLRPAPGRLSTTYSASSSVRLMLRLTMWATRSISPVPEHRPNRLPPPEHFSVVCRRSR
jgi:hypothetical protein